MRGRVIRWLLPLVGVGALGVGAAMAATTAAHSGAATVKAVSNSKYGMILQSSNGHTLYRYTPDRKGKSNCTGACVAYWPAYLAKGKPTAGAGANSALLGTIKRGKSLQVTYAGYPLYTYVGDTKAGAVKGEAFQGTWYVVNTKGAMVKHAVASPPATTTTSGGTTTSGSAWG
jgi:predicted lipoprotein with Yx(FWY)xxD motif